ncbi:ATP-binding protein [Nocardioides sp. URHA0032]|uniref:ATP-binding protein n=1 Tax=Nocardioides sp. URHA0032 TaxID=1380388 RepID=UPI000491C65A|nr:LuxR family transcriptional regulator [Nocardioides sp. URHA0032]
MERASGGPGALLGRRRECAALDDLVTGVKGGASAAVVLHGDAGIGKSALLDHVRDTADGCRVARASGVEAEVELAFGGLHQLCAPFLDRFDRLPGPQRMALETAFGLSAGTPPDRFLVGLAVLTVLAGVAEEQPLVCLVDDAQWLDQVSAQTLAFVARRLHAERVLLVFAMRDPVRGHPLDGLPRLEVRGLDDRAARALLSTVAPSRFDRRVRDRILAEARGNPLALIELPGALTSAELGSRPDDPERTTLTSQLERTFRSRVRALTPATQRLLLVAAAEPVGDIALLRDASRRLDLDVDAAVAEAEESGLLTVRTMVRFRHPLVRAAVYRSAAPEDRREVHRALAEVTDPDREPDRLAWHLASATTQPDEAVAAGLERAAARARARGGERAAAAFLDRAAQLTPDPVRRGSRALAAARAKGRAGEFDEALELLDEIRFRPLDDREAAEATLVRGQVLSASRSPSAGLPLLLEAAQQFERLAPGQARETYRDAFYAGYTAGQLPGGESIDEVAAAVLAMRPPRHPTRSDQLLEGVARLYADGYAAGVPLIRKALTAYCTGGISAVDLAWLPLACRMAHNVFEDRAWAELPAAMVELAREVGALSLLPSALLLELSSRVHAGDLVAARTLVEESEIIGEVTGSAFFGHYGALVLEAWLGDEDRTRAAIAVVVEDPMLRTEGKVLTATEWAAAVLDNGLGRHEEAYAAAVRGSAHPQEMGLAISSMIELVEAAARIGRLDEPEAAEAARRLAHLTAVCGGDWALGTGAYVAALQASGPDADALHREAVERLERTEGRLMAARARLAYGEWLRAAGRRAEARDQLVAAHRQLSRIGARAYAERARRELAAAGVATERPTPQTSAELTAQESQIARLAAAGLTNPEIGAQLFISAHTVEWHLRKVFTKLGVRSRKDIGAALAESV